MTKEQEKAIEHLEKLKEYKQTYYGSQWFKVEVCADEEMKNTIDTILNLLQIQQEEMEKKDKIIDEMTDYIDFDKIELNCSSLCVKEECQKECIKQYFERKINDDK